MRIDEAIEKLGIALTLQVELFPLGYEDAIKLGIEAMKYVLKCRVQGYHLVEHALPGETEDVLTIQEHSLKRGNEILALGRKMIKETDELLGKPTSSP